jgi:hypothetical protein
LWIAVKPNRTGGWLRDEFDAVRREFSPEDGWPARRSTWQFGQMIFENGAKAVRKRPREPPWWLQRAIHRSLSYQPLTTAVWVQSIYNMYRRGNGGSAQPNRPQEVSGRGWGRVVNAGGGPRETAIGGPYRSSPPENLVNCHTSVRGCERDRRVKPCGKTNEEPAGRPRRSVPPPKHPANPDEQLYGKQNGTQQRVAGQNPGRGGGINPGGSTHTHQKEGLRQQHATWNGLRRQSDGHHTFGARLCWFGQKCRFKERFCPFQHEVHCEGSGGGKSGRNGERVKGYKMDPDWRHVLRDGFGQTKPPLRDGRAASAQSLSRGGQPGSTEWCPVKGGRDTGGRGRGSKGVRTTRGGVRGTGGRGKPTRQTVTEENHRMDDMRLDAEGRFCAPRPDCGSSRCAFKGGLGR